MVEKPDANPKILVVGTSGCGKSTLASNLSRILGIRDIELDALFWKENWVQSDEEEFREKIGIEIRDAKSYVMHGNYLNVKDLTWGNANTVIWLDYPLLTVMWRVIKRTVTRIISREELWAGNRETFGKSFLDRESIILWSWNTYNKRREQYTKMFMENSYRIKNLIVFRDPKSVKKYLEELSILANAERRQSGLRGGGIEWI